VNPEMAFEDPFKVNTFPALADILMEPSPDRFAVTAIRITEIRVDPRPTS
jgi:hypothetical protein